MKHLKFYVAALVALTLVPNFSRAQAMQAGQVKAFIVNGDVQIIDKNGAGTAKPLVRGQIFSEGSLVKAGPTGNALLVFSNGATMKVLPTCQVNVDKFQQAKFDTQAEGEFLRLTKDPSKSETNLDLRNGTLQGEVKQINTAAGSKFTVNTPAGSAGIRGTVLSITVIRDASGKAIGVTANCLSTTGAGVVFTPSVASTTTTTGGGTATTVVNTAAITEGTQISVSLGLDASGNVVGSVTGAGLTAAQATAAVAEVYAAINQVRAQEGLAPIPAPTVTATGTPTVNGGATPTTTQNVQVTPATTDQPTVTTGSNPPGPPPPNNNPPPPPPPNTDPSTLSVF